MTPRHRISSVAALTGLLLATILSSSGFSFTTPDELPSSLEELIQVKNRVLDNFREQRGSGDTESALSTLRRLIVIHRAALEASENEGADPEIRKQLLQVYADDGEFLSDELISAGFFEEAAELRQSIERGLTQRLGADAPAARRMFWLQQTAAGLAGATEEQRTAFFEAIDLLPTAREQMVPAQAEDAVALFRQITEAYESVVGRRHPDLAILLNDYALSHWLLDNYEKAEELYQQSLQSRRGSVGRDSEYAKTLINLGLVYQTTEEYEKAEGVYREALTLQEDLFGAEHETVIETLEQLYELYQVSNQADKLPAIAERIFAADPVRTVLSHVPEATYAAALLQPAAMADDERVALLPFEIIEAGILQEFGFNPLQVEVAVVFMTTPVLTGEAHGAIAFRMLPDIVPPLPPTDEMEEVVLSDGQSYLRKGEAVSGRALAEFGDGVIVIGTDAAVRHSVSDLDDSPVANALLEDRDRGHIAAVVDLNPVRPLLMAAVQSEGPLPPPLQLLARLPMNIESVRAHLDLSSPLTASLRFFSADEQQAEQAVAAIQSGLTFAAEAAGAELDRELSGDDPVDAAARAYARRITNHFLRKLEPTRKGTVTTIEATLSEETMLPALGALLLPAIEGARAAGLRARDENDLKQIGLGFHQYHDVHGALPPASIKDADGNALLSWRVALLPYLGEEELHARFHLDEPWDSPHNRALVDEIPDVYFSSIGGGSGSTPYQAILLSDSAIRESQETTFDEITDGLANTILVVQSDAESAIIWTKPEDLHPTPSEPFEQLGFSHPDGIPALFADASVQVIPYYIDPDTLWNLFRMNDGNAVRF